MRQNVAMIVAMININSCSVAI